MKEEAAPPRLLAIEALKAFWSRKLPLLWIVAPRPVERVLLAVLVQLVVPARLSVRALIEREAAPERASAPWKVVEPVPLSVPAVQLLSPVTVSDPVPPRVPEVNVRAPMDEAAVIDRLPADSVSRPVPVNDRMLEAPDRKTVSKAPSSTSSLTPGRRPESQLPARSQKPWFAPIHVTGSGWAAPAEIASEAAIATARRGERTGRSEE